MSSPISRRNVLKIAGATAGAAIGTRLAGPSWLRTASAANEKSAVVVVFCQGGYNQMFTAADCCVGRFGVTDAEVEAVGNGLAIHKPTFGTLSAFTKQHMAAIGAVVPVGADHDRGIRMNTFDPNGVPWTTRLAAAMGGAAAIKAAHLGVDGNAFGAGGAPAVNGVSLQSINNLDSLLEVLPKPGAAPPPDPKRPDRALHAQGTQRAFAMSKSPLDANPTSLVTLREGYNTAQDLLKPERAPKPVDFNEIAQAYAIGNRRGWFGGNGANGATDVKWAAAELLVRSGTNVVLMNLSENAANGRSYTFDSHAPGGTRGEHERHLMGLILPGLRTFTSRMLEDPDFNVVVAFIGDFCRTNGHTNSPDDTANGHGSVLSASVMGKYVKTGTTGRTYDAGYQNEQFIGGNAPGAVTQLWSYLASVAKAPSNPFGANPHQLVL